MPGLFSLNADAKGFMDPPADRPRWPDTWTLRRTRGEALEQLTRAYAGWRRTIAGLLAVLLACGALVLVGMGISGDGAASLAMMAGGGVAALAGLITSAYVTVTGWALVGAIRAWSALRPQDGGPGSGRVWALPFLLRLVLAVAATAFTVLVLIGIIEDVPLVPAEAALVRGAVTLVCALSAVFVLAGGLLASAAVRSQGTEPAGRGGTSAAPGGVPEVPPRPPGVEHGVATPMAGSVVPAAGPHGGGAQAAGAHAAGASAAPGGQSPYARPTVHAPVPPRPGSAAPAVPDHAAPSGLASAAPVAGDPSAGGSAHDETVLGAPRRDATPQPGSPGGGSDAGSLPVSNLEPWAPPAPPAPHETPATPALPEMTLQPDPHTQTWSEPDHLHSMPNHHDPERPPHAAAVAAPGNPWSTTAQPGHAAPGEPSHTVPGEAGEPDNEETRLAMARQQPGRMRFHTNDGRVIGSEGVSLVGRAPAPRDQEQVAALVTLDDGAVSKTHLQIRISGPRAWVTDRASTNGTMLVTATGQERRLTAWEEAPVAPGEMVRIGATELHVAEDRAPGARTETSS
ncbi:FHA domain-containing protein [Ruania alkalisoli]|uniref:FHA domain-containing protein n=1 Tax=Ruania alkalisoli TaxID=2779775 RepID=A0A7M1SNT9_9MICO|nr:FHA domain-containing protein [Ruania alkalisoli]QOR69229.1 FHA domain-containing protein [Ruania alkalisoli]